MEYVDDALEAIKKVREYFEVTQTVFGFEVEKAELIEPAENKDKKYWDIRCTFYPSLLAKNKVKYSLLVDAENNRIYKINKDEQNEQANK